MSELTRLKDEATRLLTVYEEYKDSPDEWRRRKAHIDLDRFLMQHRDTAILLFVSGLQTEIDALVDTARQVPWYKKLLKGGSYNAKSNNTLNQ